MAVGGHQPFMVDALKCIKRVKLLRNEDWYVI